MIFTNSLFDCEANQFKEFKHHLQIQVAGKFQNEGDTQGIVFNKLPSSQKYPILHLTEYEPSEKLFGGEGPISNS